jgi:hypothetical protein
MSPRATVSGKTAYSAQAWPVRGPGGGAQGKAQPERAAGPRTGFDMMVERYMRQVKREVLPELKRRAYALSPSQRRRAKAQVSERRRRRKLARQEARQAQAEAQHGSPWWR